MLTTEEAAIAPWNVFVIPFVLTFESFTVLTVNETLDSREPVGIVIVTAGLSCVPPALITPPVEPNVPDSESFNAGLSFVG